MIIWDTTMKLKMVIKNRKIFGTAFAYSGRGSFWTTNKTIVN